MVELTQDSIGTVVDYYDPRGERHDALITNVFGPQCCNVVFVNDVEGQKDNYGNKLLRVTSLMHGTFMQAHGNFWLERGEKKPAHTEYGYYQTNHPNTKAAEIEADSAL